MALPDSYTELLSNVNISHNRRTHNGAAHCIHEGRRQLLYAGLPYGLSWTIHGLPTIWLYPPTHPTVCHTVETQSACLYNSKARPAQAPQVWTQGLAQATHAATVLPTARR